MKIKEITDYLETYFPLNLADDWDRCGLQIGNINQEVDQVMIALTPDLKVMEECIKHGVHLLITHHPLFFIPINIIDTNSELGQIIHLALTHHITIYSLHTCMDKGPNISMNKWLMEALNIFNSQNFNEEGLIKIANINETLESLIERVKQNYQLDTIAYVGELDTPLNKLAIVGGSGADFIDDLAGVVDVYITGDIKYHDAQNALSKNLCLIDVGHFAEKIMVKQVNNILKEKFNVVVFESNQKNYIQYR